MSEKVNAKEAGVLFGVAVLLALLCWAAFGTLFSAEASTNISPTSTEHYAWNDTIGWIDFYNQSPTSSITVTSQKLTGYASSSAGDISLDCATTRIGNICGTSNYFVANDGTGNLSGWGWNDAYGWVSFCGGQSSTNCPGTTSYEVKVEPTTGVFTDSPLGRNYAWNDLLGWISFNCDNVNGCGTSNYQVKTTWISTSTSGTLDSTTFDTGISGGAQINSVLWNGTLPSPANGAYVGFQFAVANASSGPWSYKGSDGTSNTWYTASPGTPKTVDFVFHNNARYFRYRVKLVSNQAQTLSPRVNDINVNWSR
jgi:hypothetical protein